MLSSIKGGQQIQIDGIVATITQHFEAENLIQVMAEGRHKTFTEYQFVEMYKRGTLRFIGQDDKEKKSKTTLHRLTDAQLNELERRREYVEAVTTKDGIWIKSEWERKLAIEEVATKRNEQPPSMSSVRRWYEKLVSAKHNHLGLLSEHHKKGNRDSYFSPEVTSAIEEAIQDYCLKRGLKAKIVYERFLPKLLEEQGGSQQEFPSYSTFVRRVRELPAYVKVKHKKGYCAAQSAFPNGRTVERPKYRLQWVEIDHTPLDVEIVDKDGKSLGRPWATFLICCKTKMIIGFYISMTAVNRRNVVKAILNAVLPKSYVKEMYKDIRSEWPCYGLFSRLITDNGKDLLAIDVEKALESNGTWVDRKKKMMPHHKGSIERFMRTINESLFHTLPGTTSSNYQKKTKQQAEQEPCLTFEELNHLVHKWIIDKYHMTIHRELNDTPLNIWKCEEGMDPPTLPEDYEALAHLLLAEKRRTLQKNGIEFLCLTYQSEDLAKLARRVNYGRSVKILYNPDNLGAIKVIEPDTHEEIEAQCVLPEYANGEIDLRQHLAKLKMIREHQANVRKANGKHLRLVGMELGEMMMKLEAKSKDSKKRQSQRHKLDPERLKTSDSVRGVEKISQVRTIRKLKDDPQIKEMLLDFEPFVSA